MYDLIALTLCFKLKVFYINIYVKVVCRVIAIASYNKPNVIWEDGRVAAKVYTYAVKSPLVTMARHKFAPKLPLPVDRSPNPITCLMPGPVRPMTPNGIRI